MENLVWTLPAIDSKLGNDVVLISLNVDDKRHYQIVKYQPKHWVVKHVI